MAIDDYSERDGARARVKTDDELHGGHEGLLIKHVWVDGREEEAGDPGSATACSRTRKHGWVDRMAISPSRRLGRARVQMEMAFRRGPCFCHLVS